jgi:hypothetical protein
MGLVYGRLARVKQVSRGECGSAILLMAHQTTVILCGTQLQLMAHGSQGLNNGLRYILEPRW